MNGSDKLNDKIKDSFKNQNNKAPESLWRGINHSLNQDSSNYDLFNPVDQYLFKKIKQSFTSIHSVTPEKVWQSINKQLNLDIVWQKISSELDYQQDYKQRMYRRIAASLLLLISFSSFYYLKTTYDQDINNGLSSINEYNRSQDDFESYHQENNTAPPKNHQNELNNPPFLPDNSDQNFSGPPANLNEIIMDDHYLSQKSKRSENKNNDLLNQTMGLAYSKTNKRNDHNLKQIDPLKPEYSEEIYKAGLIPAALDQPEDKKVIIDKTKGRSRFSIGPVFAYNNSWLLNNETRSSFEKGSLISNRKTFKENLGVSLYYKLSNTDHLAAEIQFISKSGQEYNKFEDGTYHKKGLELNYTKTYLLYQKNLFSNAQSLFSNIIIKSGFYTSYLAEKQGELQEIESRYSKIDYGFLFALGQEKQLGPVVLAYGVNVERGFNNIFLGNETIPARFNKTYVLNVGTFLTFRYSL